MKSCGVALVPREIEPLPNINLAELPRPLTMWNSYKFATVWYIALPLPSVSKYKLLPTPAIWALPVTLSSSNGVGVLIPTLPDKSIRIASTASVLAVFETPKARAPNLP